MGGAREARERGQDQESHQVGAGCEAIQRERSPSRVALSRPGPGLGAAETRSFMHILACSSHFVLAPQAGAL
jgi:hypothetical protein